MAKFPSAHEVNPLALTWPRSLMTTPNGLDRYWRLVYLVNKGDYE